jgi:hypothetical protein
MPYIHPGHRKFIADGGQLEAVGELNYMFSMIINDWLQRQGKSYATLNGAIGALECCKLELYRRVAAPYEDQKCKENGDVYHV